MAALALLAACQAAPATADQPAAAPAPVTVQSAGYEVLVDPDTGCEYWHINATGLPLIPRTGYNFRGGGVAQRGCK